MLGYAYVAAKGGAMNILLVWKNFRSTGTARFCVTCLGAGRYARWIFLHQHRADALWREAYRRVAGFYPLPGGQKKVNRDDDFLRAKVPSNLNDSTTHERIPRRTR